MKKSISGFRNKTMLRRVLIPIITVMLVQATILSGSILFGGTIEKLNENAIDILSERVIGRKNYLENEMIQRWSNIDTSAYTINSKISGFLEVNQKTSADLIPGSELSANLLNELATDVNWLLRRNSVTGAFIILNGDGGTYPSKDESIQKSGYYVRDLDPGYQEADAKSDLVLVHAPLDVVSRQSITTDIYWTPQFEFEYSDSGQNDFYFKPTRAAEDYSDISPHDLSYWSSTFDLSEIETDVLTFSMPLVGKDGTEYGVLGVDISGNYLKSMLPYDELSPDKHGNYMLAIDNSGDRIFTSASATGMLYSRFFDDSAPIDFTQQSEYEKAYLLSGETMSNDQLVYGCVEYLALYNSNTPFENERLALVGLMEEKYLFDFSSRIESLILWMTLLSIVIGLVGVYITGTVIAKPISDLATEVKHSNPQLPIKLHQTKIREIDQLSEAIEILSLDVATSASRVSQIIDMASAPIGAFEYSSASSHMYCTKRFFEILGVSLNAGETADNITAESFLEKMGSLHEFLESDYEDPNVRIFKLPTKGGATRWVRLHIMSDSDKVAGIIEDITSDTLEKQKIEYERDYDLLTNLLNRRAFYTQMHPHFQSPEDTAVAALVMLDLDNLKFINDTYGHDYGDEYIKLMAKTLKKFSVYNTIIARMSGDEFFIFFYGYKDKAEVRAILARLKSEIYETVFPVPDNKNFRIRASAGVAWYPDDAKNYDDLVKYADFAMYKVKNTTKGEFNEFSMDSYKQDSYLLRYKEELNKFIDGRFVEYHFQPIVDSHTGKIFAYEALMRSTLPTLKSPAEILALAKSQSKLHQIEKITWTESLKAFSKNLSDAGDALIFINSISNQMLSLEDRTQLEQDYADLLPRIVMELTEQEELPIAHILRKKAIVKSWKAKLALDDYGTGYNGDTTLLEVTPNFVKIDMSLVRDIHLDKNRQVLLHNLIEYSHERQILVIAEGVECYDELFELVRLKADLLQGYYLGIPKASLQQISQKVQQEILIANQEN